MWNRLGWIDWRPSARRVAMMMGSLMVAVALGCASSSQVPTDGGAACTTVADCGAAGFCFTWACTGGVCTKEAANGGLSVPTQAIGDCQDERCDTMGGSVLVANDADLPQPGECLLGTCKNGTPGQPVVTNEDNACGGGKGVCKQGACLLNNGQACSTDTQCLSTFCTDGYCCNGLCDGLCATCGRAGALGTCTVVSPNVPDPGTCEGTKACTGLPGGCKLTLGQPCLLNADCITYNCTGVPKTCQ